MRRVEVTGETQGQASDEQAGNQIHDIVPSCGKRFRDDECKGEEINQSQGAQMLQRQPDEDISVGDVKRGHGTQSVDEVGVFIGEEFVAFLPQTEREGARVVLERLRVALAESDDQPPVTCSIGLACYHPGDSRKTLQRRADEALYAAKAQGRDRVVQAG